MVARILSEDGKATREELEMIFQRSVLKHEVEDRVLKYLRDCDLKRTIICELFHLNVREKSKPKNLVIYHLATLTGYHQKSVVRLLKNYIENYDELEDDDR